MTASSLASVPGAAGPWAINDLAELPGERQRYELAGGSLLVTPIPALSHARAVNRLHALLLRRCPVALEVGQRVAVVAGSAETLLVPDLVVAPAASLDRDGPGFEPGELHLVVEVLSAHHRAIELILKRHYYAALGIPRYWIVDPRDRTLTVLTLTGAVYEQTAVVAAGERWRTDWPFPAELDPGEFC
jgi:Uma2 family endonuclease